MGIAHQGLSFSDQVIRDMAAGAVNLDPPTRIPLTASAQQIPLIAPPGNFVCLAEGSPTRLFSVDLRADRRDGPPVSLTPGRSAIIPWSKTLYVSLPAAGAGAIADGATVLLLTGRNIYFDLQGTPDAPVFVRDLWSNRSFNETVITVSTQVFASHASVLSAAVQAETMDPLRLEVKNRGAEPIRYSFLSTTTVANAMTLDGGEYRRWEPPPTNGIFFALADANQDNVDVEVDWHGRAKTT